MALNSSHLDRLMATEAGLTKTSSRHRLRHRSFGHLSSLWGLWAREIPSPTDESVGYCRSSQGDLGTGREGAAMGDGIQKKGDAILIFWEAQAMSGENLGTKRCDGGGGNEGVRLAFSQWETTGARNLGRGPQARLKLGVAQMERGKFGRLKRLRP
jgi:hypothetical protein